MEIDQSQIINIPYYKSYATDLITYQIRLTPDQMIKVQTAIAEICLYGETSYNPENSIEKMYFDKMHTDLKASIKTYRTSVINGKKGGRPKNQKKPMGFSQDNPEHNPEHNPQANHNRTRTITKDININKIEKDIDDIKNIWNEFSKQNNPNNPGGFFNNPINPDKVKVKVTVNDNVNDNVNEGHKSVYGEHKNIKLTENENLKLQTKLGLDIYNQCIEKLSSYKKSTGKKYKSDYATFNTWVIDSVNETKMKQNNYQSTKKTKGEINAEKAKALLVRRGILKTNEDSPNPLPELPEGIF